MPNFNFNAQNNKFLPAVLVVLVIGIALLGTWREPGETKQMQDTAPIAANKAEKNEQESLNNLENTLETRLEQSLSQIKGVGSVEVTISLATGPKYEYAINVMTNKKTVDEKDQSGGTRVTTEITEDGQLVVVRSNQSGSETPVIAQEYKPDIQGVLVVAQGAQNPRIKAKLLSAVQTVLNLEPHKVDIQSKE